MKIGKFAPIFDAKKHISITLWKYSFCVGRYWVRPEDREYVSPSLAFQMTKRVAPETWMTVVSVGFYAV